VIFAACQYNLADVLDWCLTQDRVNLQQRDAFTATPIHVASYYASPAVVSKLVEKEKQLHVEKKLSKLELMEVLDSEGHSPLMFAAKGGNKGVVSWLLS
jgi:ankyrin repeat protein